MRLDLKNKNVQVAVSAITAGMYTTLGYVFAPISFLGMQFRVAEVVVGMVMLFPLPGLIGKIIGVFLVNLVSPLGALDMISVLVNIPALYCIIVFRKRDVLKYLGGFLYATIIAIYVAWLLNLVLGLPVWLMFLYVLVPEVILAELGILIFSRIRKALEIDW
jgi:uncharacterized membrane protein